MSTENLKDKIHKLRDQINSSICYKQSAWERKDDGDWSKLWTAVDNIEDTQSAINEYFSIKNFSRLAIYGILQAMVVQQNCVTQLENAIQIKVVDYKIDYQDLYIIRGIRDETVGHPKFTSISHTNNLHILEYGVWSNNGFEHKTINLKDIINIQHNLLAKEIDRIMKKINEDETQHKQKFKDNKLVKLLASTGYHIQKLWSFESSREYSKVNFETLKLTYEKFKAEIKKRFKIDKVDEQGVQIPGLILAIQHIEKILPRIEKMVPMDDTIDQLDLDVYVESLDRSFNDLRKMAKEIDDEFNSKI